MHTHVFGCPVCTTRLFVACMSRCLYIQAFSKKTQDCTLHASHRFCASSRHPCCVIIPRQWFFALSLLHSIALQTYMPFDAMNIIASGICVGCACIASLYSGRYCCRHNMKLRSLLEHEAGAPPPAWAAAATTGLNDSDSAVSGAPLWELSLLTSHYHPHLSQAAAAVAHIPPQGVSLSALS